MTTRPASPAIILADIAARLLAALEAEGYAGARPSPKELAPLDHFHGRGLAATREIADLLDPAAGSHILDIGCGIGGPARFIAESRACRVSGIDLTPAFVEAALALTAATGQQDVVDLRQASALDLPFPDDHFDGAYSQNVIMNIADRPRFYGEAARVLKPGGRFALSNVTQGPGGALHYPVPWATTAATSFLATPAETRAEIEGAGLEILVFDDRREAHAAAQAAAREQVRSEGPPKLSTLLLMGERMKQMMRNSARNVTEDRIRPFEILLRKPA